MKTGEGACQVSLSSRFPLIILGVQLHIEVKRRLGFPFGDGLVATNKRSVGIPPVILSF
jgi:hypothetical protein